MPQLNNVHDTLSHDRVCAYLKCIWLAVKTTRMNIREMGMTSTLLPVLKLNANNRFMPQKECVRVWCTDPGASPVHYPPECHPAEVDWVTKLSTAARAGGWTVVDCDAAFGFTPTAEDSTQRDQLLNLLSNLGVTLFVVPRKVSSAPLRYYETRPF